MSLGNKQRNRSYRFRATELNTVLAYAASLMLTGISPQVCESVITEFYCSVKKSLNQIIS